MASLDTLNITDSGLININQKIVNNRTYASNLITAIGNPTVIDGVAIGFSSNNYFVYSPLNFKEANTLYASFKGRYISNSQKQCAFELKTTEGVPLTLTFENNRVYLTFGTSSVFTLKNLINIDDSEVSISLVLRETSFEFTMNYGSEVTQKVGELDFNIPIQEFQSLSIGNSVVDLSQPWYSSVNLKEFTLLNNGEVVYTPSIGTSWQFSNILVSDGAFPLTDSTPAVVGHVLSFPVQEISHSGNTVLLTCQISEDAYLTIREIGLYIQGANGKVLFGTIKNLNIRKAKDLSYNLVFNVDTTINVVNAIGFPAEDGIIVNDPDFVEFKDFTTVQQVNAYVLTNLERIIRMNAGGKGSYENSAIIDNQAGIGHNRAQVVYRIQQDFERKEDCYNTLDTFVKLINKFHKEYEEQMDPNRTISTEGNITIPLNGNVSGFSTENYAYTNTPFKNTEAWKVKTFFTTDQSTVGTPVSLGGTDDESLGLSIQDNSCHLKIKNLKSINPAGLDSYYHNDSNYDMNINDTNYYAWIRQSDNPMYNFHCTNLDVSNSSVVTFPSSSPIIAEHPSFNPEAFTFRSRVKFNNLEGYHYIVGSPSASDRYNFEIFTEDNILKANIYDGTTGNLITQMSMHFGLKINRYYNISLAYKDGIYRFHYVIEPIGDEYAEGEEKVFHSDSLISLQDPNSIVLGVQFASYQRYKLDGDIDMFRTSLYDEENNTWNGALLLDRIYTLEKNPSNSPIYDTTTDQISNITVTSTDSTNIIDQNIFPIEDHTLYMVEIEYVEDTATNKGIYRVIKKKNNNAQTEEVVLYVEKTIENNLTHRMNIPSITYIGINPNRHNPYSATVNLLKWVIEQGTNLWTFNHTVTLNDTELLQYYRVPDEYKSTYTTKDLCNLNRIIRFLNNKFEGNEDAISFLYKEGLTICAKVDLKDSEPKVILYKSNLVDDIYFSLTFLNQALTFSVKNPDGGSYTLSKKLNLNEYDAYIKEPIMITVTYTPHYEDWGYLRMYKNNELIVEPLYIQVNQMIDPSMYILSNYLTSTEEFGRYVQDLVVIKGSVSETDLKYINNLFDTNY